MAQLSPGATLGLDQEYVHASVLGTTFTGRLLDTTVVGEYDAVVPTVRGRAWVTGLSNYLLDPDDPFPAGFLLGRDT